LGEDKKIMNDIEIFKQKFDIYLKNYLDKKTQYLTNYTKDQDILDYCFYAKKITLAGGKRIRPYIAYLMYESFGGKEVEKALKVLVSLEVFHSFCLIHDDIIDRGTLRHGLPTLHIYIAKRLKKEKRYGDLDHIGTSQAMLVGDIFLSWSQENLNLNKDFAPNIMNRVKIIFYQMLHEVAIGQMIDVDITTRNKVAKTLIDEKIRLKTAGYSFIKPLQIGMTLTGEKLSKIDKFCEEFGLSLGTAFQTQDDLLDITSTEKELSKTVLSDVATHQHTYITQLGIKKAKEIMENNFKKAKALIENLPVEKNYKQKFFDLLGVIEKRTF